jgi:hypothetical protein
MTSPDTNNRSPISFIAKPSPPRTLNDLVEAGRIRLMVNFEYSQVRLESPVKHVSVRITNNRRANSSTSLSKPAMDQDLNNHENLDDTLTYSSVELVRKGQNRWYGEIVIPCNWFEGGSKTFERTGSFSPHYDDSLFTMSISYILSDSNRNDIKPVIELHSTDVFHWKQE